MNLIASNMIHIPKDECDSLLLERIMEKMTYENPIWKKTKAMGFSTIGIEKWIPNWNFTTWNSKEFLSIPRGQISWLKTFLKDNSVQFQVNDQRSKGFQFDVEWNEMYKPHDYQIEGYKRFLKFEQGVWSYRPGAGKTVLAMYSLSQIKTSTLILLNSNELLNQWRDRIGQFLHYKGTVGLIQQKTKDIQPVTLVSIQTLMNWTEGDISSLNKHFGILIHDESHHSSADGNQRVLYPLSQRYRMALTASKTRKDGLEFLAYDYYDKIRQEENGITLIPSVTQIHTGIKFPYNRKVHWQTLETQLCNSEERNQLIKSEIQEDILFGHRVLCLFSQTQAAENMHNLLQEEGIKSICLVSGKEFNLKDLENQIASRNIEVIVGCKIFDEGIDLPPLSSIHLCSPSNNIESIRQRVGRVLRLFKDKPKPRVVDYVDNIQPCRESALKRMQWYREFGYDVPSSFAARRLNSLW